MIPTVGKGSVTAKCHKKTAWRRILLPLEAKDIQLYPQGIGLWGTTNFITPPDRGLRSIGKKWFPEKKLKALYIKMLANIAGNTTRNTSRIMGTFHSYLYRRRVRKNMRDCTWSLDNNLSVNTRHNLGWFWPRLKDLIFTFNQTNVVYNILLRRKYTVWAVYARAIKQYSKNRILGQV